MKRMLMLGGWTEIYQAAKSSGIDLTVIQSKADIKSADLPLVDQFLSYPMSDSLAVDLAEAVHRHRPFDFVHSFQEYGLMNAARIGKRLGIRANPFEPVELVCDKAKMRRHMLDNGIPSIPYAIIDRAEDIVALASRCGWPLILKPARGTASRQIHKIERAEDVQRALDEVLAEFPGESPIAEQFITGAEISVEAISWEGRHTILGVTDKITSGAPFFVETGHTTPSAHPPEVIAAANALTERFLTSIGHRYGPSHTEIILSPRGPVIVESHTRTGGDRIFDMVEIASGTNMFAATLQGYANGFPDVHPTCSKAAAIRYLVLPEGTVTALSGVDEARASSGVVRCDIDLAVGKRIRAFRNSVERPGFVLACGDTREEAVENAARALACIRVNVAPESTGA
jgi:biotin carboxylase